MMIRNAKYLAFRLVIILTLTGLTVFANGQIQAKEQESRLVVSFYSICCGIDQAAKEKLDLFIKRYEKTKRKKLAKAESHWGREGEIDYCFQLSELSRRDRRRFISSVRLLLKSSKLVHINENAVCQSGR